MPAGFVTDFASVPRAFCQLLPNAGRYLSAAIVHDYLYWRQPCAKDAADSLLLAAMRESKVDSFKRRVIYAGVRYGGRNSWIEDSVARRSGQIRFVDLRDTAFTNGSMTWREYQVYLNHLRTRDGSSGRSSPAPEPPVVMTGNFCRSAAAALSIK